MLHGSETGAGTSSIHSRAWSMLKVEAGNDCEVGWVWFASAKYGCGVVLHGRFLHPRVLR
eukprot:5469615-Alexandrium_andersonii.AAC.1